jgi:hypothetical protein
MKELKKCNETTYYRVAEGKWLLGAQWTFRFVRKSRGNGRHVLKESYRSREFRLRALMLGIIVMVS